MFAGERRDVESAAYSPPGPNTFAFPDGHAANVAMGKLRLDVDAPQTLPLRFAQGPDMANTIPVTCGYAWVSKSDRDDRNPETQLRELANHGIRQEHILSDQMTGRGMLRPGWDDLMARVLPNDIIVVVWLDRFSRNFDEGV